jgi:hypothetical protein
MAIHMTEVRDREKNLPSEFYVSINGKYRSYTNNKLRNN